jgi:hypothetical protein
MTMWDESSSDQTRDDLRDRYPFLAAGLADGLSAVWAACLQGLSKSSIGPRTVASTARSVEGAP